MAVAMNSTTSILSANPSRTLIPSRQLQNSQNDLSFGHFLYSIDSAIFQHSKLLTMRKTSNNLSFKVKKKNNFSFNGKISAVLQETILETEIKHSEQEREKSGDHVILGIDIGGTSIKGALVDTHSGNFVSSRHVILTPQPATPQACASVIKEMCDFFNWKGSVGVGVPGVVRSGVVQTAANIDKSWIGTNAKHLFEDAVGSNFAVVNDADAAGYAEVGFGVGKGKAHEKGVVMMCTFGTGIGACMFVDGVLVPNLELGHLELDGKEAESYAAGVKVEKEKLSWKEWADRVSWYLTYLEKLFWPNVFIIGGGVSNAHEEWLHLVKTPHQTPLYAAELKNDAGIIGAALASQASLVYPTVTKPLPVEDVINS